jgi:hypothetical protein
MEQHNVVGQSDADRGFAQTAPFLMNAERHAA